MSSHQSDAPRFLALGDSYTIGEGVAAPGRWPQQLVARLRERGIALADPQVVATTGWTTDELAAAMTAATFAAPYALVSLLIGVNNQYRGRSVDNYRDEFGSLLEQAIELAGSAARVLVVSTPDWGVTPFARDHDASAARIADEIDAYNAAARTIAHRHGCMFVDITAASRNAGDAAHLLVADGLHPSAEQYATWVEAILPAALAALDTAVTP